MLLPLLIAAVVGYILGALPFGYFVARSKGINIFEHGSKNPGATNVKRVLGEKFGKTGKRLGNLVFFLDALKGAVATGWILVLAHFSGPDCSCADYIDLWMQITGLVFALVGHSFSCFTKFKGGKGVATAAGGFMVLMPYAMMTCLVVWVVTFYASRYVSLASIVAAIALPIAAFFFHQPPLLLGLAAVIATFVVLRHRANITRLMNGTENRFAKKPKG
ncbi:MAG: glycerol-3-phosphate 1-O-acyltransferase PlsY [Verrucomicrobia bacterium]|nr:glycerol-3-phosphate 1-O-acyltransferase PlsY [Verrucomicrobiota bacterium]